MGDASEENYLPGPLLDTREVGVRENGKMFKSKNIKHTQIAILFTYFLCTFFISLVKQSCPQIVVDTEG